jgi:Fe2+ or Zn2+ uptake regulation protein
MNYDDLNFRELFRDHGLRHTRQRELVYSALASTMGHPTADELFHLVRSKDDGLSLATVYNTLDALCECGLCRKLPTSMGAGPCRYDADVSPHVHVSTLDGRMLDVPTELSRRLLAGLDRAVVAEIETRLGVPLGDLSVQVVERASSNVPVAV